MSALLDRVYDIFPKFAERRHQRAGTMSGGERQMLAVGRALMSDPKLLMLDEPSLGLAPAVVETMYETFGRLHREGLTILLAEQSVELALEVSDFATVFRSAKASCRARRPISPTIRRFRRLISGLASKAFSSEAKRAKNQKAASGAIQLDRLI